MSNIFSKDEDILSSPAIVGYQVLSYAKKKKVKKISIFDVADHFKKEKWFSTKNLYFAMIFLFAMNLIEFDKSYINLVQVIED
ncbi:MAG: hypothetical protein F4223_06150 [Rhodobacteraceae bacterium]|nr:hypothetical protein [Paracoccaceae bacterium]